MNHSFTVEELKTRIDRYLASQLPGVSRSQIQKYIEAGLVEVNGKLIRESKFTVRKSDTVLYHQSETSNHKSELQTTNTPLKVLYNNHGLLIIDKPAGMVVHPGAGFKGETLASALLYHFKDIHLVGEDHRPGIVHRLDKDTSGVMLVARTPVMYEYLKDAFAERKVKKEYIALVWGEVKQPHGFIETSIGKSKTDFRKQTAKNPVEGKEALTEYKVLERLGSGVDKYTLLMVKLHTGRTHQIRVHFASIGHPLMGDELYGNKKTRMPELHRQFLHAKKIEVQLPFESAQGLRPDKTWIEAESEFPDDLKKVLISLNSKVVNSL